MQKTVTIALLSVHMASQALGQGSDPSDSPTSSSALEAGLRAALQDSEQDELAVAEDYARFDPTILVFYGLVFSPDPSPVKSSGGTSLGDKDWKTGGGFGGKFGYDFGVARDNREGPREEFHLDWRVEFDANVMVLLADDSGRFDGTSVEGDASVVTLMLNGIADFDFDGAVTPYAGVGLGLMAMNNEQSQDDTGIASAFAYQLMTGASIEIQNTVTHVGVRYLAGEELDFTSESLDLSGWGVEFGLRLWF